MERICKNCKHGAKMANPCIIRCYDRRAKGDIYYMDESCACPNFDPIQENDKERK